MADKSLDERYQAKKNEIAKEQAELHDWVNALAEIDDVLARNGDDAEAQKAKAEILEAVAAQKKKIEKLSAELATLEVHLPARPEASVPKFDRSQHPILGKAAEKAEPSRPVSFRAGDLCEAQWTDKQWYKAKVQTVMGSSSNPQYLVAFLDYKDQTHIVGQQNIRLLPSDKKRKAETALATPTPTPALTSPYIISGPESLNPNAVNAKKDSVDAGPQSNRRKIGSGKALDRKASNWKEFTKKGPGKSITKKDSMFRTGEGVNSRVGFTGSGAGMSETRKRVRYDKKAGADDEPDEPATDEDRSSKFRRTMSTSATASVSDRYLDRNTGNDSATPPRHSSFSDRRSAPNSHSAVNLPYRPAFDRPSSTSDNAPSTHSATVNLPFRPAFDRPSSDFSYRHHSNLTNHPSNSSSGVANPASRTAFDRPSSTSDNAPSTSSGVPTPPSHPTSGRGSNSRSGRGYSKNSGDHYRR